MKLKYKNGHGEVVELPASSAEDAQRIATQNVLDGIDMYDVEIIFDENQKEKYEAPQVNFIPFDEIHRLTEPTIPMRASEINDIPDHLRGQMVCAYCWEPLFNAKTKKYYNFCPGCGRKLSK